MANGVQPICQAIVLCDGFHQSPSSLRFSLLDTIGNVLLADAFPQPWSPIVVYLVLTGGHGPTELTLRWIGPDGEPLGESEQRIDVEFGSPLETREVVLVCDGLVFPELGEYRVELSVTGEIMADRRVFVFPVSGQEAGGSQ
jgi:hypothetical protein